MDVNLGLGGLHEELWKAVFKFHPGIPKLLRGAIVTAQIFELLLSKCFRFPRTLRCHFPPAAFIAHHRERDRDSVRPFSQQ